MPLLEVNTITIEVQYNNYSRSEVIVFFTLQAQQAALARGFAVQHPSAGVCRTGSDARLASIPPYRGSAVETGASAGSTPIADGVGGRGDSRCSST